MTVDLPPRKWWGFDRRRRESEERGWQQPGSGTDQGDDQQAFVLRDPVTSGTIPEPDLRFGSSNTTAGIGLQLQSMYLPVIRVPQFCPKFNQVQLYFGIGTWLRGPNLWWRRLNRYRMLLSSRYWFYTRLFTGMAANKNLIDIW